jgi:hypothetical protein
MEEFFWYGFLAGAALGLAVLHIILFAYCAKALGKGTWPLVRLIFENRRKWETWAITIAVILMLAKYVPHWIDGN